ncbi:hypothetical protein GCM10022234_32270 [Aeromicrobium panaciterrae]|uniref:hypothetical protein n=1 Tax=Aeromicrobium panaciterrae TaxID=363861 RepID=UPI0031D4F5DE
MNSQYVFRSRWDVPIGREALWDEVESLLASGDPMVWWGSVEVIDYDGTNLAVRAASAFGYRLEFRLDHLELSRPDRLTFDSAGDLRGSGVVTFVDREGGRTSAMHIDWRVEAARRWMRLTGWLLRPVFVAGHRLIMRQGEKHLNAWLESR